VDVSSLIIGTYTEALPHVTGTADGLLGAPWRDLALGDVSVLARMTNPSFAAVSSDGSRVYVISETDDGTVSSFARPDFRLVARASSGGSAPCHVTVTPDDRFVLVAHYGSGTIAAYAAEDDALRRTARVQHEGPHPHAHMCRVDPVSGTILVCDLGLDVVFEYALDDAGTLTEVAQIACPGGPRHLAFHPDGSYVYVLGEHSSTVTALRRTPSGWRSSGQVSTLPADQPGPAAAAAILVSPNGRQMFTSNRGHDSIAVLALDDPAAPALVDVVACGGRTPRDMVFTPDGDHVLVANQDSNNVALFAIGASLTPVWTRPVPTPVSVAFVGGNPEARG
jgi:6-phosphogluconolactonase